MVCLEKRGIFVFVLVVSKSYYIPLYTFFKNIERYIISYICILKIEIKYLGVMGTSIIYTLDIYESYFVQL